MTELFGQVPVSSDGHAAMKKVGLLDYLIGPYYTGMGFVMTLPQFKITLYGPTSPTIHKEVATRFAGDNGMLIEFDHPKQFGDEDYAAKGFDVSWISRYGSQEAERYHSSTSNIH